MLYYYLVIEVLLINTKRGLVMGNIPKTISFRTDEITSQKMEKIKELVFEGRDVSNALILRTAVDFLHDNYGKGITDVQDTFEVVKAYITVAFLIEDTVDFGKLDYMLYAVERVHEEQYQEETEEIARLYNDENPITIGKLIRFKNRIVPETFLRIMGIDEEVYSNLSEDELADLLLKKFTEEEFRADAKRLFHIEA